MEMLSLKGLLALPLCLAFSAPMACQAQESHYAADVWGTADASENISVGGSFTFAPHYIYGAGPRLETNLSYDRYVYRDWDGSRVVGESKELNLLGGVAVGDGDVQVTGLVGPALVVDSASSINSHYSQSRLGGRALVAVDIRLPNRAAASFGGSYSTVFSSYSAYAGARFRMGERLTFGPQVALTGNRNYWQVRVGPALSSTLRDVRLVFSGGMSLKDDGAKSAYLGFGATTVF